MSGKERRHGQNGEGRQHTKWFGSLEVIWYDRRRLPPERRFLQGACKAPPLCINISPLILVTLCLLHPEQAGPRLPLEHPLLLWKSNGYFRTGCRRADPLALPLGLQLDAGGKGSEVETWPCWDLLCDLAQGAIAVPPEPLFPHLQSGDNFVLVTQRWQEAGVGEFFCNTPGFMPSTEEL